ncbi:glutathione S-transferase family protein [Rivibacter subsaxonicus]|uniref:Glutathione S-transferase n=1 Tax=Rivibacter subsaxonicus TaxID=457575 RepID=A0A4Q7VWN1_9BURK|nr:glutathione S-transferase family protein [Rivibacter subsaxonicus]RZU01131.1 glutathione S-transferase [Rivibacter subsaxonicus]
MIQLHYHPSTASMAPHIVLEELGVPYQRLFVDKDAGALDSAAYRALNPNGKIPVLVDGELVLYESAAICLHLADTHADAGLLPPVGSAERAQAYQWLVWLTNTLQATLIQCFYPERQTEATDAVAIAAIKSRATARVGELLGQIEAELERHGGPWLLGANYSVVDIYAFMLCRWTRNFARPARSRPAIHAWQQRVLARPAVQRMFANEGLSEPWF